MNARVIDYLVDKMDSRRGVRGSGRRGDRRDRRDYEDERDYADNRRSDYADNRRGDRRDYEDERDYADNRRGDRRDYEDGHKPLRLTKSDMHEWKQMLENADGSRGPHYDMQQIMSAAEKHGIHFKDFTEAELCMATNMMYADYCRALKKYIKQDEMLECCVHLAVDFLNDPDGPEAEEKLALYYHCIVNA